MAQILNSSERLNYRQTLQRPSFKNNYFFQLEVILVDIQAWPSIIRPNLGIAQNARFVMYPENFEF